MTKRTRAAPAPALPANDVDTADPTCPDRRMLLASAGAAAALIASTAPGAFAAAAVAPPDPDAALWLLREEWVRKRMIFAETMKLRNVVEARVFARRPDYPDLLSWRGTPASFTAEVARIKAAREAIDREEGVPAMEEADDRAIEADAEVVGRIAEMPAHTMAGICFKARVSADWNHDYAALTRSIMRDLAAFAAHPASVLPSAS